MRASRLLAILLMLQSGGVRSAPDLARSMGVSSRTILRDIDHLCEAGVPIWTSRGREGGFHLREGWSTQLTGFTHDEAQAIGLSGQSVAAADLGMDTSAQSARTKVLASLPAATRVRAERVGTRVHVDPAPWYRNEPAPTSLATVAAAVWSQTALRVEYESWARTSTRVLHPLGLVLKAGVWYVVATRADDAAPGTYKLANLRRVELCAETFCAPKRFRLDDYWRASVEAFETKIYAGARARLRVLPNAQRRLNEMDSAIANAARESAKPDPEQTGWVCVEIPIESNERAAYALLALGADVEVLAPLALRTRLEKLALEIVARYQK